MTRQKSFKRLVRTRMEKTGESYTAARAMLLAADEPDGAWLATSDERIRERTGRGWEEWFDLLDTWGELTHREIARRIAAELGIDPLAWNAQAITMSYERTRGGRLPGQREDGFAVTATKTLPVPVEQLFDAFLEQSELRERTVHEAEVGPLRLGRRGEPRERHLRREGRGEQHGVGRAPAARRPGRGRADEGVLARAAEQSRVMSIAVATVAAFLSGGAYYTVLGPDADEPMPPWKLAVEVLRCLVLAAVVAGLASQIDIDEWAGGLLLGLVLWIGFPFVLWTGAVIHESTPVRLAALHAGDWLVKLLLIGVIVVVLQ